MREPVFIGDTSVPAGQRRTIDLPIAKLYTHTDMTMPVHVIHGRKEGPRLFVSATIHGDEINGSEIIRRLLRLKLLGRLHGTLVAIPIVNVYGYVAHTRYLPDRRDLNRSFPGSEKGSLAGRLAHLFIDEIVSGCTHGIDLHSGSNHRQNLPQIRAGLDDAETERMARAFGAPVIIESKMRDGSLREAVREMGSPMLVYEGGEALRFNEMAINLGVRGIVAVMRQIGMLPGRREKKRPEPLLAKSTTWVRAPISGILPWRRPLGARVDKGDAVAVVADPFGEQEETVRSPVHGIVIGRLNLPMVHAGDAMFNIASLDDTSDLEGTLEALEEFLSPEGGPNVGEPED
ncbi:MAG: succinylglutamate desuccinylase [Desulfuromonadales bacterium]|nr:succinylglutamate desuccinylase [Desulfuromonadales bacterium]NIR33693.1 succinylglutamate desuccinylase [Desulfuromonadales bacterium]NIS44015.1 succinylglutamate desuccinylase [Desulfuromonadales bacterium]